jgi:predicted alpha-1,2-mannosidase
LRHSLLRQVTVALVLGVVAAPAAARVDVFVGSAGDGNTTPAAAVPFGFAQPGPDTVNAPSSGYAPGQRLLGFSQTHLSGTGGAGKYGNFRVPVRGTLTYESGGPGWYSAAIDGGRVRVDLTATRMGAVHRYVGAHVTIDPASVIATPSFRQRVVRTFPGGGTFAGGWNPGTYTLWYATRRQRSGRVVTLSIGLSFRSLADARRNIPRGGFAQVRAAAKAAWARALGRIRVSGGTPAQRDIFQTALYHSLLMPHEVEPGRYDDFLALWDTFRTQNPLLGLVYPEREAAIVRSLLGIYRRTGWLPDAWVAGQPGVTQVGSDADIVIADAVVKNLPGIDLPTAYRAVAKDASVQSDNPALHGRDLRDYAQVGYVSTSTPRSASRTLEYAYDDFAVAEVARRAGHPREAKRWLARSRNWANLFDPVTGVIRPRARDGSFASPFDPNKRGFGFVEPFYEGTPLQWTTFVPHDVRGLIEREGGDDAAVAWLDSLFTTGRYDPANEPDLLAPYLYIHMGRPDRTDDVVRDILAKHYSLARDGLPGNDDGGTLSAWYVWSAMGLFPDAGKPYYYIGSPLFSRTRIALPGRRTFTIEAPATSDANRYVMAATLNGKPLRRAWLTHAQVARGGVLHLGMGPSPSGWGRADPPR